MLPNYIEIISSKNAIQVSLYEQASIQICRVSCYFAWL